LLAKPDVPLLPAIGEETLLAAFDAREQALSRLMDGWLVNGEQACDRVLDALDNKILSGTYVKPPTLEKIRLSFRNWVAGGAVPPRYDLLSAQKLAGWCRKGKEGDAPAHPFLSLIDEVSPALDALTDVALPGLLAHARAQVIAREEELKRRNSQLSADDLLREARRALDAAQGDVLVTLLRQRYTVAMVDEFQDTDSHQYAIFSRVFGQAPEGGLLMIGDPKQAIYKFRGADIYTYLAAREDSTGQFSLDTNFRSTDAMVSAVNRVFSGDNPFLIDALPFKAVNAANRVPPFTGDATRRALHFALADQGTASQRADDRNAWQAEWIAAEARRLLGNADARIGERRLAAGDIAVLVRSHSQASAVRDALALHQIPCVYQGRDSVFSTAEATDLTLILAAMVEPENAAAVRNALACSLLALPLSTLHDCLHEEQHWADALDLFVAAHQRWRRRGVLPALYQLFEHFDVLVTLRAQADGERRVTDVLHLCELLQQQGGRGDGPRELHRWFERQRAHDGEVADEQKLRLESDDALVQIVTIHASKGLQYPVVFVAGMGVKPKPEAAALTWYHDDRGQLIARTDGADEHRRQQQRESQAEDRRLLYVALTRSIYRCYVTLPTHQGIKESPVAALFDIERDKPEWHDLQAALAALADDNISFSTDMPEQFGALAETADRDALLTPASPVRPDDSWRISSYTGLTRNLDAPAAAHFSQERQLAAEAPPAGTIAAFPRGARAGICLHALFERLPLPQIASVQVERVCEQTLAEAGLDANWRETLVALVQDTLATPFGDDAGTCLARATKLVPEMEFMLAVDSLDAAALDDAVALLSPDLVKPSLSFAQVEGMLRGFIDVVAEIDGCYWLVDYKSNWLGNTPDVYQQSALDQSVAEHRYDVQASIYAVALHRYLARTISDYDATHHFGGVAYLFLRGMDGHTAGQGVWMRQPDAATLQQWDRVLGGRRD